MQTYVTSEYPRIRQDKRQRCMDNVLETIIRLSSSLLPTWWTPSTMPATVTNVRGEPWTRDQCTGESEQRGRGERAWERNNGARAGTSRSAKQEREKTEQHNSEQGSRGAGAMKNEWRRGGGRGPLSPSWPSTYTAESDMTLPIPGRDPVHTFRGRPVSVHTLGGRLITGSFYSEPFNYPGIQIEYPWITGWFPIWVGCPSDYTPLYPVFWPNQPVHL